jgi:hypothetical protein
MVCSTLLVSLTPAGRLCGQVRASAACADGATAAARHARTVVDDGVTLGDGEVTALGLMTRVKVAEAVGPALAVTVTVKLPDAVGVPLIVPVTELIVSPAGSPPAVHVAVPVPPVATMAAA